MFFLSGVARFLFVPMAESVMFAMVFSFLLSRTLVPTHGEVPAAHARRARRAGHDGDRRRGRGIRWCAFNAASRRASCGCAPGITTCWRSPSSTARALRRGLSRLHRGLVPARAVSRPQFLSAGRRRSDPAARAGAGRHAHRGDRRALRRCGEGDPPGDPAGRSGGDRRQHRHLSLVDQYDLQQYRHDRRVGRRHPDLAQRGSRADRRLRRIGCARSCRAASRA